MNKVLVFDFGASSGRAVICTYDGGKLSLNEVHRFPNDPVSVNGTLYWDILRLFHEIKTGLAAAHKAGGFDSVGIDTWGVDFGLLDKDGRLIANPVHYRDTRTNGFRELYKKIPRETLYARTGIQEAQINTVFQLAHLAAHERATLDRAETLLMIPDLFGYFLTGVKSCEYTNATTTGLVNLKTGGWDYEILEKLDIPRRILPKITLPGTRLGMLSSDICGELDLPSVPVYNVASHDTASAIVAVPAEADVNFAYISSGTWSLLGTELDTPLSDKNSMSRNLSNEGGINGKICYLTNILGMWLFQESRRHWNRNAAYSFAELDNLAEAYTPDKYIIDVDAPELLTPGNMPIKLSELCRQKYGDAPSPDDVGAITRIIIDSLAAKYAEKLSALEAATGRRFDVLHVIGGGSKSVPLCRVTAAKIGRPVIAGPVEATVIGNALTQLIASGAVGGPERAREIVRNSFEVKEYS